METIAAFDAKTRLSELLDRSSRGESFQITKHGRPVGKLVPPDVGRDPKVLAEAVASLKRLRGRAAAMTPEALRELIHDGHRF